MRTLSEIVDDVKAGGKPDYDELRYALLAYVTMYNITHRQLQEELAHENPQPKFLRDLKAKNSFDVFKGALQQSPKEWLGPENDPDNPEYQKRIKAGNMAIDRLLKREV